MVEIVNYLELCGLFKKIVSDEFIIYSHKNHSIMISKQEDNKMYLMYDKKMIAMFKVSSENIDMILERLKDLFNIAFPQSVDENLNSKYILKKVKEEAYAQDESFGIKNLPNLDKYMMVISDGKLIFISFVDSEIVYCIKPIYTNKKERENMRHFSKTDSKFEGNRLQKIFTKVVDKESYRFKISLELLKIGCEHKDESLYVFMGRIFVKLGIDELFLTIKDTDLVDVPFKINDKTLDEVIEYLEGIYE